MSQPTFHAGEQALQRHAGVADKLAEIGPRVIRGYMPDQHREFFAQLPWLLMGSIDATGRPVVSVLAGAPGFICSPDAQTLVIGVRPPGHDPVARSLAVGSAIGLLGIEPHTRRRNRMNGVVTQVREAHFVVQVTQSFGNCPKYIQAREPHWVEGPTGEPCWEECGQLDQEAIHLIGCADTFFIASAHPLAAGAAAASHGVDVSHRGGQPGFVRVDSSRALTVPDYQGNFFFNTLGNLQVNPQAGMLFIDFDSGDLLHVAVSTQILLDGPEIGEFAGAQRLLRCEVQMVRRLRAALLLRWGPAEQSPHLPR